MNVISKAIDDEYLHDDYGHYISKREPYFCVNYLEKSEKSSKRQI